MNLTWKCVPWTEVDRDDLHDFMQLRIDIFVVEQNCPYPEIDGKDRKSIHLFARNEGGKMVAYIRILPAHVSYEEVSIGRVVVDQSCRGTGLGYELMQRGMDWIDENWGKQPIRIGAQEHLEVFYGNLGFVRASEPYLEDGIPHIEMTC
jgi:ElaA protein